MARSKLVRLSYKLQEPLRGEEARELDVACLEERKRTCRRSLVGGQPAPSYVPVHVAGVTLGEIKEHFVAELGCEFDFDRVLAVLGAGSPSVPRRLSGTLLIELSKHLHSQRRMTFLSAACETLHQREAAVANDKGQVSPS